QPAALTLSGTIDLTNNILIAPGVPSDAKAYIATTHQITTSTAGRALGYADAGGGNFEVRATLPGDSDLNGIVNVGDLGALATGYGVTSGAFWINGDFDYNGSVDVSDLGA